MFVISSRRSIGVVVLFVIGAVLAVGTQRAAAQVRPDAPGSAPLVRLSEPRIAPLPAAERDLYVRIRGTSTDDLEPPMDGPGENPWHDLWFYSNPIFIEVE